MKIKQTKNIDNPRSSEFIFGMRIIVYFSIKLTTTAKGIKINFKQQAFTANSKYCNCYFIQLAAFRAIKNSLRLQLFGEEKMTAY